MTKVFKSIFKWLLRILLGIASLLVLLVLLFYLFRGKITERALTYVNEMQPGEIVVDKINLRPFLDFPNVSLRLQQVQYLEHVASQDPADTMPVFELNDVYVSMDVVALIRGTYMISEVRFAEGTVNYRVGADSVSNVEKALGILFGSEQIVDTADQHVSPVKLDLERFEIRDLTVHYEDVPANTSLSVLVSELESGFSYYPDLITVEVLLESEIQIARVKELTIGKPRTVSFSSALHFDQVRQNISLGYSMLDIMDAVFEVEGEMDLDHKTLDLDFSALNSGIDLLNFLLSGALDLDAIEQIGDGSIRLEGNASGSYSKQVPLVEIDIAARDMGFRIHSLDQSVTGINFQGYITNGTKKDLSEAVVDLDDFHADFPKGSLDAEIHLSNLLLPHAEISMTGDADLSVINEIIKSETVKDLHGILRLEGDIKGSWDQQSGNFPDSVGQMRIYMDEAGFSVPGHRVEQLHGTLMVEDRMITMRGMEAEVDSNRIQWDGEIRDLLPWLLDVDADLAASFVFGAEELYPGRLLNDTAIKIAVRDLSFRLSGSIGGEELNRSLAEKRIPAMDLALEDVAVTLPGYAPVSDGRLQIQVQPDSLRIRELHARIRESAFDLQATMIHYDHLIRKDSAADLALVFDLSADRLLAGDLLTVRNEFRFLPPQFAVEEIHDLKFKGKVETTVSELLHDSILPDLKFSSEEMRWKLKEYPHAFDDLVLDVERKDSLLIIYDFAGSIGESNFDMKASLSNLLDSTRTLAGHVVIRSALLDLDRLLVYDLLAGRGKTSHQDEVLTESGSNLPANLSADIQADSTIGTAPDLSKIKFPDLAVDVDVAELRFQENVLKQLGGRLSTKPYKILYLEQFSLQSETGGAMLFDGQFNVSDPTLYMLSANIEIDTVNISDFDLQIAIEDSLYSLEDNFNGRLTADGLAEFFINPDFSINTDLSTAMFNLRLEDGRVKRFAPLRALARYTGNKNLDNVKFGLLRNSFTLMNGAVQIPLMSIESTLGLILLEGEQYLDGDFLYLARLPVSLIRGTAWNILTNQQKKETEEGEVQQMRAQKFLLLTISGKEGTEEVKMGDKRDQFRE